MDYAIDKTGKSYVAFIKEPDELYLVEERPGQAQPWPNEEIGLGSKQGMTAVNTTKSASCAVSNGDLYVAFLREGTVWLLTKSGDQWTELNVKQACEEAYTADSNLSDQAFDQNGQLTGNAIPRPSERDPADLAFQNAWRDLVVTYYPGAQGRPPAVVFMLEDTNGVRLRLIQRAGGKWQLDLAGQAP